MVPPLIRADTAAGPPLPSFWLRRLFSLRQQGCIEAFRTSPSTAYCGTSASSTLAALSNRVKFFRNVK